MKASPTARGRNSAHFTVLRANNVVLWLAATAIVLTVVFGDLPGHGRASAVLQDSCHAPAFAALALIGFLLLARRSTPEAFSLRAALARCLGLITLTVILGAATEGLQWLLGRDADPNDVLRDLTGSAVTASLWLFISLSSIPGPAARAARALAVIACMGALAYWGSPLLECARAYWSRSAEFPVLARFHGDRDLYFVTTRVRDARIVPPGALRLVLDSGPWPGVTLDEPVPDWSPYRTLALDVSNPGTTALPLQLRVDDRTHNGQFDDRFNTTFALPPGARQTLRISLETIARGPRARRMDLSHIARLILFRDGGAPDQVLLLYQIWLQ